MRLRRIKVHEKAPRWMGRCWDDMMYREIVIAPVPFNWPIGFSYWIWWHLSRGLTPGKYQKHIEQLEKRNAWLNEKLFNKELGL